MSNQTITIPVTVAGETRPVEFVVLGQGRMAMSKGEIFGARIGRGTKTHRAGMDAWPQADGTWKPSMRTSVLNRQATITEWADEVHANNASQHSGSAINNEEQS